MNRGQIGDLDWRGLDSLDEWLTTPLFTIGESEFSTATLLKLTLFFALVVVASRVVRRALSKRVFPRMRIAVGTANALGNLVFYVLVSLGIVVGLQTAGVELSTLTVLFGALGVGIGFGLQNVASNFISGLIILFEQPIKIGDRIQLEELNGSVVRIGARATEIVTNDGISVIVPNSEFVSQRVINWSHGEDRVRFRIPVGVSYESDVETVKRALLEAADTVPEVLKDPKPKVWLVGFGESSIDFQLLAWTRDLLHRKGEFSSCVNYAILESLRRHGVQIPFPQRDVHFRPPPQAGPDG
jgi:small-conductance mechanosensitive channel